MDRGVQYFQADRSLAAIDATRPDPFDWMQGGKTPTATFGWHSSLIKREEVAKTPWFWALTHWEMEE